VNPVFIDIENVALTDLKENQFSGMESEDCHAHMTHFFEACSIINPVGVSDSDKIYYFVCLLSK